VTECIKKVHDFLTIGAPAPLQEAICAAFTLGEDYYDDLKASYTRKRALFCAGLDALGLPHSVPQGSYFVMADIGPFLEKEKFAGWTDLQFCEWMIREVGVAAVPGSSFFAEDVNNLIRLHFARSEASLTEAVGRLQKLKRYL
jgi:aminotransferase